MMLNSELKAEANHPAGTATQINDNLLSILTALFVDSIVVDHGKEDVSRIWNNASPLIDLIAKSGKKPGNTKRPATARPIMEYCDRKAEPEHANRKARGGDTGKTIRTFILGLSDAFNDVLMGIWGNLSLMVLGIDKTNPLHAPIAELELLIQNGSAFINGIFGYLGERRAVAKNIRLTQLIQDFNEYMPIDRRRLPAETVQVDMRHPTGNDSGNNCPVALSGSLANTLEQFVLQIQKHNNRLKHLAKGARGLASRLRTIDRQVRRAWDMINLLKLYAGQRIPNHGNLSIRPLIRDEVLKIREKHPHLTISMDIGKRLPGIHADRAMIRFAFRQILNNAVQAMPNQGNINIDIRTLSTESPQNRCVAYRWGDSMIITISDTGSGMDFNTLLRIFDPFFAGQNTNCKRLGMGLSAAWGIIKAHGGYIHVRSNPGCGSIVKLYLPLS